MLFNVATAARDRAWLVLSLGLMTLGGAFLAFGPPAQTEARAQETCPICGGSPRPDCPYDTGTWTCCGDDSDGVWYQL